MSLVRLQTCERCGKSRELAERDSADLGGWRTLTSGASEATLCNDCVRAVVTEARGAAEARATTADEKGAGR
mgnify:CR=1 FL=1